MVAQTYYNVLKSLVQTYYAKLPKRIAIFKNSPKRVTPYKHIILLITHCFLVGEKMLVILNSNNNIQTQLLLFSVTLVFNKFNNNINFIILLLYNQ